MSCLGYIFSITFNKTFYGDKYAKCNKKIGLSIAGLVQGTLGSCFALLGYALAFPDTEPGMRDYEEDMFFVPWGFVMMLIWVLVMVSIIIAHRKNKVNVISFLLSWAIGLIGCIVFLVVTH